MRVGAEKAGGSPELRQERDRRSVRRGGVVDRVGGRRIFHPVLSRGVAATALFGLVARRTGLEPGDLALPRRTEFGEAVEGRGQQGEGEPERQRHDRTAAVIEQAHRVTVERVVPRQPRPVAPCRQPFGQHLGLGHAPIGRRRG